MSIVRAKPFFVIGSIDSKNKIINELQKYGCAELVTRSDAVSNFDKLNRLNKLVSKIDSSILNLKKHCNIKKTIFKIKKPTAFDSLHRIKLKTDELLEKIDRIDHCCKKINENLIKISDLEQKKLNIMPYLKFDFCLKNFETRFVKFFVGVCNVCLSEQCLSSLFADEAYFEIVDSSKNRTVLFVAVLKDSYKKIVNDLLKLKFSFLSSDLESDSTANSCFDSYECEIKDIEIENEELKAELESYVEKLADFELLFDYFKLKLERQENLNKISDTKNVFFLEGYLDPRFEVEFKYLTKKFEIYYEIDDSNFSSPVDFSNGSFVAPIENITKTYSMPSKFDVDPNPIMAFFYYLFFGIMFSDAGYGLVMAAFSSVFAFIKKVDFETKKKFRMFFWCGVSTVFWGLMFGSFFGDFIGVASRTFFGLNFSFSPIFIDSLNEPMKLLGFSLFLGLVQIIVGVFISFVAMLKFKNFKEAFFVKFGWLVFLFGSGLFFLNISMNNINRVGFLSFRVLNFLSLVFVLVGVVFILFLSGYKNQGFFKKILSGIINLYGATSYVGDVLSYCRLMALSIATGVVANVVNLLSSMMCVNFFGFFAFLLVFIFGHLMNFGINALGAYVHTIRLQYVEFFSKFYEGGGRLFLPFGLYATKYYELKFDLPKIK